MDRKDWMPISYWRYLRQSWRIICLISVVVFLVIMLISAVDTGNPFDGRSIVSILPFYAATWLASSILAWFTHCENLIKEDDDDHRA